MELLYHVIIVSESSHVLGKASEQLM